MPILSNIPTNKSLKNVTNSKMKKNKNESTGKQKIRKEDILPKIGRSNNHLRRKNFLLCFINKSV